MAVWVLMKYHRDFDGSSNGGHVIAYDTCVLSNKASADAVCERANLTYTRQGLPPQWRVVEVPIVDTAQECPLGKHNEIPGAPHR